jgi:hypothetical protein
MQQGRTASIRQVGKFIEMHRPVDGVVTVDLSPDCAPAISAFIHDLIRRSWYKGRTKFMREAGDDVLFVDTFRYM